MDRYAVMGNPIGHSRSPEIHGLFAQQIGEEIDYRPLLVPLAEFAAHADAFIAQGGKGFNVTVPFKRDAWRWVDERSEAAELAEAVNTIVVTDDQRRWGHNTDGTGLMRDLRQNLGWPVGDARILVVGAGGAVAGILEGLLAREPGELIVANRTAARAQDLVARWPRREKLAASSLTEIQGTFDLIINGTSAGLEGELPALPNEVIGAHTRCYDLVYGPGTTLFNRWALDQGALEVSDGLGMLVEQAAGAYELWRGVRPATAPVIQQLRSSLKMARSSRDER